MINVDSSFIRSRFSRRIYKLFFLSAILPIIVVAIVSYSYVSGQLRTQSFEQSRQASKAIGMELYERLSRANNKLKSTAKALTSQPAASAVDKWIAPEQYFPQFIGIAVVANNHVLSGGGGNITLPLMLEVRQEQLLAEGKSVVAVRKMQGDSADILLVTMLNPGKPEKGLLVGTISPDYLWDVKDLLAEDVGIAILDSTGDLLFIHGPFPMSVLRPLATSLAASATGYFDSAEDGDAELVAYWTLFTEDIFSMLEWTIVASQSEDQAMEAIIRYRSIYIPLLMLVMLVVSFISVIQIRKRLAPLSTLKDATRSISQGDFSGRISIVGDDEFTQLGMAFNSMADRLERQFKSLNTLAEIDQLILSSFDARQITSIVLGHACDLTPCSVVAMIELNEEHQYSGRLSARRAQSEEEITEVQLHLSSDDIHRLAISPHSLMLTGSDNIPAYLTSLHQDSLASVLLLPMFIKQHTAAVIIFGYANNYVIGDDEIGLLRKFTDHVAVALSNAMWEEQLYHQAHYDALTDLPNRALLVDRLEQAITRARRNDSYVGVAFLDLDRFKVVNDSLGHAAGDQLLKEVARLLKSTVRNIDTVVRFGGDEFIVIIPDIDQKENVVFVLQDIAEKLIGAVQHKVSLGSHDLYAGTSIGIAVYPKDGEIPDELIKNADTAMYQAKDLGRGQFSFYSQELNAETQRRLSLEQELRKTLERGEFRLFYQAKVNASGDSLVGAEALIRWQHPERGLIFPIEFIDIAEETGLIHSIGEWVIQTACAQMRSWLDMGLPAIRVAVNVSSHQFNKEGLDKLVQDCLDASGLTADALELEITESVVMAEAEKSIEILKNLHNKGVRIAMDDFGTGYSSLSYLRRLPINTIKIDQSFISDMVSSPDDQAIVSSTIYLAHQLGLDVVAEGVETRTQQVLLNDWGCDALQGYLFSKPLPVKEFEQLLRRFLKNRPSRPSPDDFINTSTG